ncbi:fatty acid desaturase family protein [Benzoatithermus flavus]|uniref:Fatty acid desaturase family protein n=1 Tax=Benzoatithermus flavus TaxID=3108223 RepID=A0ABU8XSI8_9PROT
MTATTHRRDYSLTGEEGKKAVANGLAGAQWYACPIPRKQMKELMARSDQPAIRDTILWFALILAAGALVVATWGTWWAVPALIVYGALYGGAADSRWHESGHGTAFRTRWMNDALYQVASFMVLRQPTVWRWSHSRHHTDTIIVGRDPEIAVPRPPDILGIFLNLAALKSGTKELAGVVRHAMGSLDPEVRTYVPESEQPKVVREARIWLAIWAGVGTLSLLLHSWLPLVLVGLPSFYGAWLYVFFGLTQHAGLAEDVLDHRLNSRTVYMNPVFRFLYWNMNYHVEHHMFPMVPYHALPKLHAAIKDRCPPAYPSTLAAYREIVPTLLRQRKDPGYHVKRELPPAVAAREAALMAGAAA